MIAKRRHRIHSPFVYDFGDKCLNLPIPEYEYGVFKALRASFLADKTLVNVDDLGAGSKKLKQQRTIRQIAKTSGSNKKYGKLLYRLVAHYQAKHVLELGTSLGLGTYMMAAAHESAQLTTIEGCQSTYDIARRRFPSSQHHKVKFINSPFVDYLKTLETTTSFDLIFIDGDHKSQSLLKQLELLSPHIHDETIIVLDDIRWSKDMLKGWRQLVKSDQYHLTLDLFQVGLLMKRSHQEKEHFVIRY